MSRIFVVLLLLVSGCTTKVHLITQGYSSEQLSDISQKIHDAGFDVLSSTSSVPVHYSTATIALNPAHKEQQDIPKLERILEQFNIAEPHILRFGSNKHFYSNGHIGVYLRHPNINPNSQMPPYIESVNCASGYATIGFSSNQKMHLETGKNINGELELTTQQGLWSFDGQLLHITLSEQATASFTNSKEMRNTPFGQRRASVFNPKQKNHSNAALNCQFEVIFIN